MGLSSLTHFPELPKLKKLILADNRISKGLENISAKNVKNLEFLSLAHNRIKNLEDLDPLKDLKLEHLDLFECPVEEIEYFRTKIFSKFESLKILNDTDKDGKCIIFNF